MAHLYSQFGAILPGEFRDLAFNFTNDVGTASIVSNSWTCIVRTPGPSGYMDFAPQAHIISTSVQTAVTEAEPPMFPTPLFDDQMTATGVFSVARVGGFVAASTEATYTLGAIVTTSDGRILELSADLPIGQP